ncbi:MAG: GyrI-like domain-containing protein [Gordonia sp. (in: high G+C Gram-positive bacteria)]|uniref:GyrI-like domain-containing protein n=1 Tax=Gordonia sp. (in: high G+C Gram-positive bacteria) TaxID=84139 RepID=UPI0039E65221
MTPLILQDAPFTTPTDVTLPDGVVTVVHRADQITMDQIHEVFDNGYSTLAQAGPIGPGYAIYSTVPTYTFDLEIGFPVTAVPDGFTAGTFPSGRALALSHLGPFDGLGDTWNTLFAAFEKKAAGSAGRIIEVYVTDPSQTDAKDLRTDLFVVY